MSDILSSGEVEAIKNHIDRNGLSAAFAIMRDSHEALRAERDTLVRRVAELESEPRGPKEEK